MSHKVIQVEERVPLLMNIPLSLQHLFAMFGATVLVPFLFKLNPNTCLFMNGVGTLLYIFLTKGKIPSYLGSSFAFISPVLLIMATHPYSDAQSGFIVFGLLFVLFSFIVKMMGTKWIDFIFPPAAMGAIVSIIGLELAPTAASMAGLVGDKIEQRDGFCIYLAGHCYRLSCFQRIYGYYPHPVRSCLWLCPGLFPGDGGYDSCDKCALVCCSAVFHADLQYGCYCHNRAGGAGGVDRTYRSPDGNRKYRGTGSDERPRSGPVPVCGRLFQYPVRSVRR